MTTTLTCGLAGTAPLRPCVYLMLISRWLWLFPCSSKLQGLGSCKPHS